MRRLYTALLLLLLPAATLLVWWRGLRERNYWRGWRQRFGRGYPQLPRSIWIHAVSMGEVQAALPLLERLRRQYPQHRLLITSATPAGRERARQVNPDAAVCYAPYDYPAAIRRVLRATRPSALVILETEIWPNLLHECASAELPVLFASARMSARTLRRLRRFGGLVPVQSLHTAQVAAQSDADAARFRELGLPASHIRVSGNLKFDRVPAPEQRARGAALRQHYAGDRRVWVAGSTHAGEEEAALAAHRRLRHGELLVLAPRHAPRFGEVATLLADHGVNYQRRSAAVTEARADAGVEVLLLDTLGELGDFYAAADLAFVGGTLVPVGGHNLLEPAALGVATLCGPHLFNAPDIARALHGQGGLRIVPDADGLAQAVAELMVDDEARRRLGAAGSAVVEANRGALQRVSQQLDEMLDRR